MSSVDAREQQGAITQSHRSQGACQSSIGANSLGSRQYYDDLDLRRAAGPFWIRFRSRRRL